MKLDAFEKFFKTDENGFIIDFKQVDKKNGFTPLMFSFFWNKSLKLNLTHDQLDFLIKNSDFKQVYKYNENALIYAFFYNKEENLNLTLEQFEYMINNSDLNLIYNCKDKNIKQELKNIQAEINNKNILNKINNKEIIKKIKI